MTDFWECVPQRNWKQLLASKPDDKYEDPKDVAAMELAKLHMGDYKLKTADNYKVCPVTHSYVSLAHELTNKPTHLFTHSLIDMCDYKLKTADN